MGNKTYIATAPDGTEHSRTTARAYSHAVLIDSDGWGIYGFCGRIDLAQSKAAEVMRNRKLSPDQVVIAEAKEAKKGKAKATKKQSPSTAKAGEKITPSPALAAALTGAFDHFNDDLFDGKLPQPVFVWQRKKNCRGHFHGGVWKENGSNDSADEISLNPDLMEERSAADILSTLVHEMCHQLQHHFGEPSRTGYHNKEWAEMMKLVGLHPSSTGQEGGKETGQRMTHYVIEDGRFDRACQTLMGDGWAFPWTSLDTRMPPKEKKKSSKVKFTCPQCEANAWGAASLRIYCAECDMPMGSADL